MTDTEAVLNEFLVTVFNDILRLEEMNLQGGPNKDLSVSEMHVLEAVENAAGESADGAGMAEVAAKLAVTSGTLSVAVKTLEQKGYLVRRRACRDKRRVIVDLTEKAVPALRHHTAFHEALVARAAAHLSEQQTQALIAALTSLHEFFTETD